MEIENALSVALTDGVGEEVTQQALLVVWMRLSEEASEGPPRP